MGEPRIVKKGTTRKGSDLGVSRFDKSKPKRK